MKHPKIRSETDQRSICQKRTEHQKFMKIKSHTFLKYLGYIKSILFSDAEVKA